MLILVGESASGKSSIEKHLVDNYGYNKIVSYTTRQPRQGAIINWMNGILSVNGLKNYLMQKRL